MKITDEQLARMAADPTKPALGDVLSELLIRRRAMNYTGSLECWPDSDADFDDAERKLIREGVLSSERQKERE